MHIPSFRDCFFYRATLVATFEVSFSIRKEFLKKKINGGIAFPLSGLFDVQIKEPASRSTTTRAIVFLSCQLGPLDFYQVVFNVQI